MDVEDIWYRLEPLLFRVSKPSRYIGNEWNCPEITWDEEDVSFALAYPDIYEIGMSNVGLRILQEVINEKDNAFCERVFMPWLDMADILREEGIPLFSLESFNPIPAFDILGFSLPHELTFTNVLEMLALAGIPLRSENREGFPLVIGGGSCSYNPEPLFPFFDFFVLGEGEEVVIDIIDLVYVAKNQEWSRDRLLKEAARIPGVYVPCLYGVEYYGDGRVKSVEILEPGVPERVKKRAVNDLDLWLFPRKPILPFIEAVHDRFNVELFRGCTQGCRFCQAGMVDRPVRERSSDAIYRLLNGSFKESGHNELSLTSLSSSDYSQIREVCENIREKIGVKHLTISLPSLRMDNFSVSLASGARVGGAGGLTFAPEAGNERLRCVINKKVTDDQIIETARRAAEMGWNKLKLYFMIGLPTETEEDVKSIADLVKRIRGETRSAGLSPLRLNLSLSTFVPKSHTPFQWTVQDDLETIAKKQGVLRDTLRTRKVKLKWHDRHMSTVEGVLARGDRRTAALVEQAWRLGCRFDSWSESFSPARWEKAMSITGIDPDFYLYRQREKDEVFPWEHLSAGLDKEFLWEEYQRALRGETTVDCRGEECQQCGVCDNLDLSIVIAAQKEKVER